MSTVAKKTVSLAVVREDPKMMVGITDMRKLVTDLTPILAKSLPVFLKAAVDRVGSSLLLEMSRNPHIAQSSAVSLLGVLIQTAQLGLELGGPLGQCYAVPYWNGKLKVQEAQWQCGYKGLIQLAHRAAPDRVFDAHPVFENDEFDISAGSNPYVTHKMPKRGLRGAFIGAYALYGTPDRTEKIEYMSAEEIEEHKQRYAKKDKNGQFSAAWTGGWEMHRKTPLRRLGKRVPLSAELVHAASLDEMDDADVRQNLGALVTSIVEGDDPPSPKVTEVKDALGIKDEPGQEVQGELLSADDVPR